MKYMGLRINKKKLMKTGEVVDYLRVHGENYSAFSDLRDIYEEAFGKDLVWNYQCCGDFFPGFYLMPVREGFLSIPYNEVEVDEFEQIVADNIELLSAEDLQFRLERYRAYAVEMMSAMEDMIAIAKKEHK